MEEERMGDQRLNCAPNEEAIEDLGLAIDLTANARSNSAEGNNGRT